MGSFVVRRLLSGLATLVGVSIIVFLSLHLAPGDPVTIFLGDDGTQLSEEFIAEFRRLHGFDQPLYVQYFRFLRGVLRLDFQNSIRTGQPIAKEIVKRLPATLELGMAGLLVAIFIGVTVGTIAAVKRNSWVDHLIQPFAFVGVSLPGFWLGIILVLVFAITLKWFPMSGRGPGLFAPGGWRFVVLPALAMGASACGLLIRLTRTSMLDVMSEDYIRTARAKGLSQRVVVYRHALRNAAIPVVTVLGLRVGQIFAGSIIIETVFSWPGMGRYMVNAIRVRDFPVVQAMTLVMASIFIVCNILVDLLYGVIDPRIRHS